MVVSRVFIVLIIIGAIFKPIIVTDIATMTAISIACARNNEALFSFFSPIALAISDVVPILIPTPSAIIIKYTGKVCAIAARASADIFPAKNVSTTLYKVWKIVPTLEGIAIFIKSFFMGSFVRE